MIYDVVAIAKLFCYSSIAISAFILCKYICDFFLDILVFIFVCSVLYIVVIGAARDPGNVNEQRYLKFMPQFPNHLCFFSCRTLSETKAFNFFK